MSHVETHGILSDVKLGYRKCCSAKLQMLQTIHDLALSLDNRGRDGMTLLQFDVVTLMERVSQVHYTSEATNLVTEFADVFKDELELLKCIQVSVTVDEAAPPQFHKPKPVPFALKEKVEQ